MNPSSGNDHLSTADNEGFLYQKELLQYSCLMMREMRCQSFEAGYEVAEIPKFDDVVCKFKRDEEEYHLMFQSKWTSVFRKITKDVLLSSIKTKGTSSKAFNMGQYFQAILDVRSGSVQETSALKFIMFTNQPIYRGAKDLFEDSREECMVEFFRKLAEEEAEIKKFSLQSMEYIEEFLERILNINCSEIKESAEYIRENFIFVFNSPDLSTMKKVNDKKFLGEFQENKAHRAIKLGRIISEDISQYIKFNIDKKTRKFITNMDFENILANSIMKYDDIKKLSKEFLQTMPAEKVEFQEEVLEQVYDEIQSYRIVAFDCEKGLKLNTFKVFQSIQRKGGEEVLLVPLSELTDLQKYALRTYKRSIVVFVDEGEKIPEELIENECLVFVQKYLSDGGKSLCLKSFSFADLTNEARCEFLNEKMGFKLQMSDLLLGDIDVSSSEDYNELIKEFFVTWFNKKVEHVVELGRALPRRTPEVFIYRRYYTSHDDWDKNNYLNEHCVFSKYHRCILKGGPGLGKSSTLLKVANDIKKEQAHIWIEFFELRYLSKKIHIRDGRRMRKRVSFDEAKNFLLDKFLSYGENALLDRKLFEYYLTLEEPPILIIFDGFDEIMPVYEEFFINLIRELSLLRIRIWVSGRLHCKSVVEQLPSFSEIYLSEYDKTNAKDYLQIYMLRKFIYDCCSECRYEDFDRLPTFRTVQKKLNWDGRCNKISLTPWLTNCYWCQRTVTHQYECKDSSNSLDNIFHDLINIFCDLIEKQYNVNRMFFSTPLFLKMVTDIIIQDYKQSNQTTDEISSEIENFNTLSIYDKIFEHSFRAYYEKEGVDPTNNYVIQREGEEMARVRKIHFHLAIKELDLMHLLPQEWAHYHQFNMSTEILGRGFIIRNDDDTLSFTHRTFAEYFASEVFSMEIESGNIPVMKYVHEIRYDVKKIYNGLYDKFICPPLKGFTYQKFIRKIKSETLYLVVDKPELLTDYSRDLIKFCFFFSVTDFNGVLKFLRKILSRNDRESFAPTNLFPELYDKRLRFTFLQFNSLLQTIEDISGTESAQQFFKLHKDEVFQDTLREFDMITLESLFSVLKKYGFSMKDIMSDVWRQVKVMANNFLKPVKMICYWYFEMKCKTSHNPAIDLHEEIIDIIDLVDLGPNFSLSYAEEKALMQLEYCGNLEIVTRDSKIYFCFNLILFLHRFEWDHYKSNNCLVKFWQILKDRNQAYDYLIFFEPTEYYNYYRIYPNIADIFYYRSHDFVSDFVGKCLQALSGIKFNFMATENTSTLYKFCVANDKFILLSQCLKMLSTETTYILTDFLRSGSKSLLDYEKVIKMPQYPDIPHHQLSLTRLFMSYFCEKFTKDQILEYMRPFEYPFHPTLSIDKREYFENLLRKALIFCSYLNEHTVLKEALHKVCSNAVIWEKEHKIKLNLLHNCVTFPNFQSAQAVDEGFYQHVFEYLKNEDLLSEKIFEKDLNGELPLDLCIHNAQNSKFFYGFYAKCPIDVLLELFAITDNEGQNYFNRLSRCGFDISHLLRDSWKDLPEEHLKKFSLLHCEQNKDDEISTNTK